MRFLDEHLIREKEYWLQKLSGDMSVTGIPLDYGRPAEWQNDKAVLDLRIGSDDQNRLQSVCGGKRPLVFTVLVAVQKIVLHKYTADEDIVVGTMAQHRHIGPASFNHALALRDRVTGSLKVRHVLENVKQTISEAYANQKYSFTRLLELLKVELPNNRAPLFSVMVVLDSIHNGENIRNLKVDLTLSFSSGNDALSGVIEFSPVLFKRETIEVFAEHYQRVLHAVLNCPDITISEIELLSPDEKQARIFGFNKARSDYPKDKTIHQLFQEQVIRAPGEVAAVLGASQLTFYDLNSRANRLAHYLRKLGVARGKIVGLFMDNSIEMIVGLLGILKAGGAYLPFDSAHPRARLAFMLEDTQTSLVLTQQRLADRLPPHAGDTLCLDRDWEMMSRESDQNPEGEAVTDDLAYVIYTSGSTGTPKGVKIRHRSLTNYTWWAKNVYVQGERVTFPLYSSLAFDLTVTSIFTPLITGNRIVIYPRVGREIGLDEIVKDERINIIKLTPSHLSLIKEMDNRQSRIKRLIVGGEALETGLARQVLNSFGEGVEIFNEYGPTEATVGCMIHKFDPVKDDRAFVPVGRSAANVQIYVLDEDLQPVAENVIRELYISGDGLADGYLNREDLTVERFLKNPFITGKRIYKTGDLARWLPGNVLEYVGRTDDQVKFQGYRVEMNEIRCVLNRHAQVRDSAVMLAKGSHGHDVIVAYYTGEDVGAEALRAHLSAALPEYMIPAGYVYLESLPLTANGKLDRRALPAPEDEAYARRGYEPPVGETETKLARIWADLLRVERVGRRDNFFELGGHSLLALSMIDRMCREGLPSSVRKLFTAPTLRGLAAAIEGENPAELEAPPNLIALGCQVIRPEMLPLLKLTQSEIDLIVAGVPGGAANVQDIYPLTALQEGILFHHMINSRGDAYLFRFLLAFDTRERLEELLKALKVVVARHDILRTAVVWEGLSEPAQVVWREAPLLIEEVELDLSEGDVGDQLMARFDPRRIRLDVRKAPLMRCVVTRDAANDRWLMLWLTHHLATDHIALDIMIQEAQASLLGESARLPAPAPFRNFVARARLGRESAEAEEFFREMLASVEEPTAPYGLVEVQGDGSEAEEAQIELDATLARRLKERARAMGVSAASVCHVAWGRVLGRVTGREDVVFGTVLFGRMGGGEGAERVLGLFINTLPIRVGVGKESVEKSVRRTQEALGGLMRHEHASLAIAQRCSGVPAPAPLFSCFLNYRHSPREVERSLSAREAWVGMEALEFRESTHYPLVLSVDDLGDGFALTAQVIRPIEPGRICEYMRKALEGLVEALERAPETEVRRIEALPEAERRQILEEWNRTEAEYPKEKRVHHLFEEQVEKGPEVIALAQEEQNLTYGELNARANRLAHHLRGMGVGADVRVAICLERSVEMVVALLGVLKAGGAYVPLDPTYPLDRLDYMLEDSAAPVLLTHEAALAAQVGHSPGLLIVNLDSDEWQWAGQWEGNPDRTSVGLDAHSLAYIIYTSGSTGPPKGVLVEHQGLVNLIEWHCKAFQLTAGSRSSSVAGLGFDAAAWEIWPALCIGANLLLPSAEIARDPERLLDWWQAQPLDVSFLPTPIAEIALAEDIVNRSLRTLLIGGDRLQRPASPSKRFLLVNNYGPTETTVVATSGCLEPLEKVIHIGGGISNARIYILGAEREVAPIGVTGDIYIGGAGVAQGYLNRPELTAERFLPDPFSREPNARLYKTGDLGRWLPDGRIEFLGRNDYQVKIRGYRVELGEIEAALCRHPKVKQCAVMLREDEPGKKLLVGYVVSKEWYEPPPGAHRLPNGLAVAQQNRHETEHIYQEIFERQEYMRHRIGLVEDGCISAPQSQSAVSKLELCDAKAELTAAELREYLQRRLPEYMAPNVFVALDELPLTSSGKVNRRALPAPSAESYLGREYEPPEGEIESELARIWGELLKVERVGRRHNFFELGGHSLLAVQVLSRLQQDLGVEVALADLFAHPALADLARKVEGAAQAELPPITVVDRNERLELSYAQQRLWFLAQLEGASEAYHIPGGLRMRGELDREALRQALDRIVARHEALRTTFRQIDGHPMQVIGPAESGFHLQEHDLRGEADAVGELWRLVELEAREGFDLERGPLIRGRLAQMGEDEHALVVTMHHIVADGWSMGILVNELNMLYKAYRSGREDTLPALPVQYADYAAWQRRRLSGEVWEEQAAYWKRALAGAPALLELPTDRPRPARQDYAGGSSGIEMEVGLTQELKALGRRHGTTLYMTLLAGWAALLGRLSGQVEVVIGTPVANRTRSEIESLIGFFVNTLALRVDLSGSPSVGELLERVKARTLEGQQHQEIPFEHVVELVQPPRSLGHTPVFQVEFAWQNAPGGELELPGLRLSPLETPQETSKFDLSLSLQEHERGIVGGLEYATALFDRETVERYLGCWRVLLEGMVIGEWQAVDRLPVMGEAERRQVIEEWNRTEAEYPRERRVHDLFEEQAEKSPDAIALAHEEQSLTYGELNASANQLAHHLRGLGVGPDARVAICVERGIEMVVALLATLKAGGAYVPLDPAYPPERLAYMLEDSAPAVLLTHGEARAVLTGHAPGVRIIDLDADAPPWAGQSESNPDHAGMALNERNLAYILYTSGSTGAPKGVAIEHGNVVNFVSWGRAAFDAGELERTLFSTSLNFDLAAYECFVPVTAGATIRIVENALDLMSSPEDVTLINTVPSAMKTLVETGGAPRSVRVVNLAGEALKRELVERIFRETGAERVCNLYGPTETTTYSTWVEMERSGGYAAHIGRPISNTQVYMLDKGFELSPMGVVGEMYIGGAGVARGYLNRPGLTAERFLPDPFSLEPGTRVYRTGDLGRWLPEGQIEFLGRNDYQVKIRGFRIELGEIETRLMNHPEVREAVVLAREDEEGSKRLVAYYTGGEIGAEALRAYFSSALPEYMTPSAYVQLESMPLTPNGKMDRRALPAPEGVDYLRRSYEPPVGEAETRLAQIWAELLKVERIGRHDNFFESGGHSLLATQVISRVRSNFGVEVGVGSVFEAPTIEGLSRRIEKAIDGEEKDEAPQLVRAPRGGQRGARLPLSFAQQRLWFIDQLEPGNAVYNIPGSLKLYGDLDLEALERVINEIVRRHEALRTRFEVVEDEPVQVIDEWESRRLQVEDLTGLIQGDKADEANRITEEESGTGFDLRRGPLFRVKILKLDEREHILLYTMHHIVSDGWSMGILIREVEELYRAFQRGEASPLPELPIQYADYAVWQRERLQGAVLEKELSYWKQQLAGVSRLELPTDKPRPPIQANRGAVKSLVLTAEQTTELKDLSLREGATLFMTLLAGFQILLGRYSGSEDIAVGTDIANRDRAETEGLIGFFVNQLVLRTDLSGEPDFRQLLGRVREVCLGAYAHQDLPFEKLVEELRPERSLSYTPLFQVSFVMNATTGGKGAWLPEIGHEPAECGNETVKYDLTLTLSEMGEVVKGEVQYNADLFEAGTIERMIGHLVVLLEDVARRPEVRIRGLQILGEEERVQILEEWNRTEKNYPRGRCLHELIEEQAERTPDRTAVIFGEEQVSYGELERRANQLSNYLCGKGVGAEAVVGICLGRSIEIMVGLLGALKAGGAYAPLDPEYPEERLSWMMEDAGVKIVLTEKRIAEKIEAVSGWSRGEVVSLDSQWEAIGRESEERRSTGVVSVNLAYVIYTSGSTGRPKGAQISHGGMVNFTLAMKEELGLGEGDRVLQFASPSFDVMGEEVYPTLSGGATVVMARSEEVRDPVELSRVLERHGVSGMELPAAYWEEWVRELKERGGAPPKSLRYVMVGCDLPQKEKVRRWQEYGVELLNVFGLTETCITNIVRWVGVGKDGDEEWRQLPIGRPIANNRIYILDGGGMELPAGVAGEIYIGGDGVGRGYHGRGELTAERFVPDPYSQDEGERLYRTGDLGRYRENGEIEFLGRKDQQVKLRGYRIELGEIEIVLKGCPGVRQAVVMARADGRGEKRLVGYVVGEGEISAVELRGYLQGRLPEYMVPGVWVLMETLPLTPNGKVDRKALPEPGLRVIDPDAATPRTAVEEILAGIFAKALNLDRVGIEEDFFELGGHSLLATRVISQAKKAFEVELALRALFESPTVKGLARQVEKALKQGQALAELPLRRADRNRDLPLSFAQQRLWLIHQVEPESALYNMPMALRLESEVDVAALERSLQEIVRRHEALRTSFRSERGAPMQIISEDWRIALPVIDLSALSAGERLSAAERLAADDAERPFDLRCGRLLRCQLLRLAELDHVLIINKHHIVGDEWSEGIFIGELAALYEAYCRGEQSPLPELEIQYADFSVWQREWLTGPVLEQQRNHWKSRLGADFQELRLPTDRPRPQMQTHNGEVCHFKFSAELSGAIRNLCRAANSTLYMVLLAAFKALLYRYTGQDVITVGSPIANRNRVEVEKLIGFFVNTVALSSDVSDNPEFMELIGRVRETALDAYTYQDFPFDLLVEELRPRRQTNYSPLITVIFETRDMSGTNILKLPKLSLSSFYSRRQPAYFDLTLSLSDSPDGIGGYFEYNTDLFDGDTIEEMRQRLESLLKAVTKESGLRLLDIPLGPRESTEGDQESLDPDIQSSRQDYFVFD